MIKSYGFEIFIFIFYFLTAVVGSMSDTTPKHLSSLTPDNNINDLTELSKSKINHIIRSVLHKIKIHNVVFSATILDKDHPELTGLFCIVLQIFTQASKAVKQKMEPANCKQAIIILVKDFIKMLLEQAMSNLEAPRPITVYDLTTTVDYTQMCQTEYLQTQLQLFLNQSQIESRYLKAMAHYNNVTAKHSLALILGDRHQTPTEMQSEYETVQKRVLLLMHLKIISETAVGTIPHKVNC